MTLTSTGTFPEPREDIIAQLHVLMSGRAKSSAVFIGERDLGSSLEILRIAREQPQRSNDALENFKRAGVFLQNDPNGDPGTWIGFPGWRPQMTGCREDWQDYAARTLGYLESKTTIDITNHIAMQFRLPDGVIAHAELVNLDRIGPEKRLDHTREWHGIVSSVFGGVTVTIRYCTPILALLDRASRMQDDMPLLQQHFPVITRILSLLNPKDI
jgi:hypothetical protein